MNAQLPPDFWMLDQAQPADGELIVDSFAGGGGASTGIEMALRRSPDFAINHDPEALALHAANHPDTVHLSKNIYKVDPMDVVGRRKVGLLWASPDCKHFSKAKGGKPVKREIRDLAWTVVLWAKRVRPRVIILENVEEFQTWGPLIETAKGVMPDPERRGETFGQWIGQLKKLGYRVEWKELRACDYGAPTTRKRLFLIARCDGQQIRWPAPTHGAPGDKDVIAGRKLPWRTAAEIIDWSEPCPSIFDTSEEIMAKHGVRAVRPLAENTLARIFKGIDRYVIKAAKPFIVTCNHGGDWFRGQGLDDPFNTVTAARDAHGLVMPHITKFQTGAVGSEADAPLPTITANSFIKRPGGAAPLGLVAPVLSSAQQGGSHRSADEPHRTVTASDKDQNQVVAAHLMTMRNAGKPFNEADRPTHTVTAGGAGLSLVEARLQTAPGGLPADHGDENDDESNDRRACRVAGAGDLEEGRAERGEDGGNRDGGTEHDARLLHSFGPADHQYRGAAAQAVGGLLVQTGYGERAGQEPRALDPARPLGTVVAGGIKHAAVAAFLAQHNTGLVGHSAEEPVSTIVQLGSTQAVVSAGLINQKGTAQANVDLRAPVPTITAGAIHVGAVRAFLMKYYGNEEEGHGLEKPLGTVTTRDRFGLVTVDGVDYEIVDIGMRMLTPRELFKAQGFPADYEIETGVFADGERRALTKTAQVRMCGNSVCPPIAAALVAANCGDLAVAQREAAE